VAVPRLHVIIDQGPAADGLDVARAALIGGAPLLQVRAKGLGDRVRLTAAAAVVTMVHQHGSLVVVNDRADVCVAAGADGVHGGADDLPVPALRSVVGPGRLVGGTARAPDTARALEAAGADYVGVGPVYATGSKDGLPEPIGPAMVASVAAAVSVPVIAIAGITVGRVAEVIDAGAHGVAVIGAVAGAPDPAEATRALLDALGEVPDDA
jgi:thiamine-phosphate pyrophosphorylase